jgi:hypothetical protein
VYFAVSTERASWWTHYEAVDSDLDTEEGFGQAETPAIRAGGNASKKGRRKRQQKGQAETPAKRAGGNASGERRIVGVYTKFQVQALITKKLQNIRQPKKTGIAWVRGVREVFLCSSAEVYCDCAESPLHLCQPYSLLTCVTRSDRTGHGFELCNWFDQVGNRGLAACRGAYIFLLSHRL